MGQQESGADYARRFAENARKARQDAAQQRSNSEAVAKAAAEARAAVRGNGGKS